MEKNLVDKLETQMNSITTEDFRYLRKNHPDEVGEFLYKIVGSYVKKVGKIGGLPEYDDFLQRAVTYCWIASKSFNSSRGSISTFLFMCILNKEGHEHIRLQRLNKRRGSDFLYSLDYEYDFGEGKSEMSEAIQSPEMDDAQKYWRQVRPYVLKRIKGSVLERFLCDKERQADIGLEMNYHYSVVSKIVKAQLETLKEEVFEILQLPYERPAYVAPWAKNAL